jgi:hypothetical protein
MINYGELQSERIAKENMKAREIVNEILNVGVNDRIIKMVIYSLAMNLESIDDMQNITSFIRELDDKLFLIDQSQKKKEGV